MNWAVDKSLISETKAVAVENTQFRSFEFLPRVIKRVFAKKDVPSKSMSLAEIKDLDSVAWLVDSFGNVKTTILPQEV